MIISKPIIILVIGIIPVLAIFAFDAFRNLPTEQTQKSLTTQVEQDAPKIQNPTLVPVQKHVAPQVKKTPTLAPISKVPVILAHNGATYYCLPEGAQVVRDASINLQKANNDQVSCFSRLNSSNQNCVSSCNGITVDICYSTAYSAVGYSSTDDCVAKRMKEGTDCVNNCYQSPISEMQNDLCNQWTKTYSDSLNNLLNSYCK